MHNYLDLVQYVLDTGETVSTRSGKCKQIFDYRIKFDISEYFPIVTTKSIHFRSVVGELLWFLSGSTNVADLHKNKISIWDEWVKEDMTLGPIYGHQWRNLKIDQISNLIYLLKTDPHSRRLIVNSWNVEQLDQMQLPPCHYAFECYVRNNKYLDLKWHQRSVDIMLGLPFNISSYALLTYILAHEVGLTPGRLIGDLGNCHIYENHIEKAEEQLDRIPYAPPTLYMTKKPIFEYEIEDFRLINYFCHPKLYFEVAV